MWRAGGAGLCRKGKEGAGVQALALGSGVRLEVFQKLTVFSLENTYSGVLVKVNVMGEVPSAGAGGEKEGRKLWVGCRRHHWGLPTPPCPLL